MTSPTAQGVQRVEQMPRKPPQEGFGLQTASRERLHALRLTLTPTPASNGCLIADDSQTHSG